jgi:hypothetical protein
MRKGKGGLQRITSRPPFLKLPACHVDHLYTGSRHPISFRALLTSSLQELSSSVLLSLVLLFSSRALFVPPFP